jgi:CheY-like chemotaxis protein
LPLVADARRVVSTGPAGTRCPTRIVVAQDDPDNRESLGALLQEYGDEVVLAETVREALRIAIATVPHVAIVDLGLPDQPGEKLIAALKALPAPPFVLAYTGWRNGEAAARASGCDAFVLKPHVDELLSVVASLRVRSAEGGA